MSNVISLSLCSFICLCNSISHILNTQHEELSNPVELHDWRYGEDAHKDLWNCWIHSYPLYTTTIRWLASGCSEIKIMIKVDINLFSQTTHTHTHNVKACTPLGGSLPITGYRRAVFGAFVQWVPVLLTNSSIPSPGNSRLWEEWSVRKSQHGYTNAREDKNGRLA